MGHITSVLLYFCVSGKVCKIMCLILLCLLHTRPFTTFFAHTSAPDPSSRDQALNDKLVHNACIKLKLCKELTKKKKKP